MPTPAVTIIPAPSDLESDQYVHGISGRVISVRVIGFKITGDDIEAITWPVITPGSGWEKIESEANGYFSAHGRQGLNVTDLGNAIKNRRPVA